MRPKLKTNQKAFTFFFSPIMANPVGLNHEKPLSIFYCVLVKKAVFLAILRVFYGTSGVTDGKP